MNDNNPTGGIYKPLTRKQLDKIHNASLTTLSETGMTYEKGQEKLVETLRKIGADIDSGKRRVRFPPDLVMAAVSKAPSGVCLYGRDGARDLILEGDRVHFGTGGTTTTVLDLASGDPRESTLNDVYAIARLADTLDNIDLFIRPCTPLDIPQKDQDINICHAGFKGTKKHVMLGIFDESNTKQLIDFAAIIAGGLDKLHERPILSLYASFSISPLQLSTKPTRILEEAVKHRVPISISAVPMAGSTGPVTMAGTLTLMHAEVMAGIAIGQILSPGAPILYGGLPFRADMRDAGFLCGTIECGMMNAAVHQLAGHIGVPNCTSCGFSDSKIPDSQAAWECAMLIQSAAMGGTNLIRHAGGGIMESAMTISYEQIVMNDEIIGMAKRLLSGINTSDEHISTDLIGEVGPGGTFLTSFHTLKHMRSEYYYGNGITDQYRREKWIQRGGKTARARAREMVLSILNAPEISNIPGKTAQNLSEKFQLYHLVKEPRS